MRQHVKGSHRSEHAVRPQGTTASMQPPFVTSVAVGAVGRLREPGNQTEHALAGPWGTDSPPALCWLPPRGGNRLTR